MSPLARLSLLGALLAALMVGALFIHIPGADTVGTEARANAFVGVMALAVAVYLAAARLALRAAFPPAAFWTILAVAAALRLVLLTQLPFLSSDIYRYVWDGQVQAAGINPYRHVPADPALAGVRESLPDPTVFPLINRAATFTTAYPPAAQTVFALVGQVSGTVTGMKVAMLVFDGAAMLCLLRLLSLARLPRERVLLYAWNPLVLTAFAIDGHVDALAVGFLALALLARARRRDGLAGALLSAAALVKFLPVAVAPAFLRGGRFWAPALAGTAVAALLYLPYLGAGWGVLGSLSAYSADEGFDTGRGYWLVAGLGHLVALPDWAGRAYGLCAAAGLAALALWIVRGRAGPAGGEGADTVRLCRDAGILAACTTAAASPHYAWYYAWLALPAAVAPVPAVLWLSAAPVLFYVDPFNDRFLWPSLVFVPAIILALRPLLRGRVSDNRRARPVGEGAGKFGPSEEVERSP